MRLSYCLWRNSDNLEGSALMLLELARYLAQDSQRVLILLLH